MPLHGDDLRRLAEDAGLTLRSGANLDERAKGIRNALSAWVLWSRGDRNAPRRGEVLEWVGAVRDWTLDGHTILTGPSEPAPAAGAGGVDGMAAALATLLRGWPEVDSADPYRDRDALARAYGIIEAMAEARAGGGVYGRSIRDPRQSGELPGEIGAYEATEQLLKQTLAGLDALRLPRISHQVILPVRRESAPCAGRGFAGVLAA